MSEIFLSKDDTVTEIFIAAEDTAGNIVQQAKSMTNESGNEIVCFFPKATTVGNTLIAIVQIYDNYVFNIPAGYTQLAQVNEVNISHHIIIKTADGTEKSLESTWASNSVPSISILELNSGWQLDVITAGTSNDVIVNTLSTGNGTPTTSESCILAIFSYDGLYDFGGVPALSNNYRVTDYITADNAPTVNANGCPGFTIGHKLTSALTAEECTFSVLSGAGNEMLSALLILKRI